MARKYKKSITKPCEVCGTDFKSFQCLNRKICSRKCFGAYMKSHPNSGHFSPHNKGFLGRKHSEESRKKMREATKRNVEKGIIDVVAMAEKSRAYTTGEKNVNWKGGISSERHKAMSGKKYKEWRTSVFERDNYTCQICEQYGGVLHADHMERWSDCEDLRYAVDNGRTLCVACHYYVTFRKKMRPGQRWCNFTARKTG